MDMSNQTASSQQMLGVLSGSAPELVANPFPLFAQMRSMGAVIQLPFSLPGLGQRAWLVTRMQEAVQVLKDLASFTVDPRSIGDTNSSHQTAADYVGAESMMLSQTMLSVDDPDHRRLRSLVSKAFTPRYIESLRPCVQEIADTLLDRVQDQGQIELVTDYAFPLPINVISEMLGVPRSDHDQIRVWSQALAQGQSVGGRDPGVAAHQRAFGEYTAQLVAQKRKQPGDDLISQMIAIEEEGDRLSEAELFSMITLLIFAGHETTSNLIATGTLMLLDYPEQLEKLKADHSLIPAAVEELLRYNGPATIVAPRFAKKDTELAGQQIQQGDVLLVLPASANRDESQFPDPEDLNIARALNRHIAFGYGIHTCLGAPLARLEGDIAFTTLLRRMPNLRLAIPRESITWHFSLNSRSLAALPLAF
ncbi:cytochrome P450 family protein [Ktedonospora formicarum]|uniref:Polyketide biosynthesis cytochrome P450 PksS n=1 Tax=Ktedonospora formicarum TaxID=2778364 RepID=A0A8J3MUR4_9CHLR|nr:cytochrome P450 [Ktedonospora formicarum]GHO45680.1 polyketide biosynthesis cytochrome P450 PksS [Ktedonospora formicarum]